MRHPAIKPASEWPCAVSWGAIVALPEIHKQYVVAIRLSLVTLLLFAMSGLVPGMHRDTLGVLNTLLLRQIVAVYIQACLCCRFRDIQGLCGFFQQLVLTFAFYFKCSILILQFSDPGIQFRLRRLARFECGCNLFCNNIDTGSHVAPVHHVDPQTSQLTVVLDLRLLLLKQLLA